METSMNIVLFKGVAFFAILFTGIVGGLFSRWMSRSSRSDFLFSMGNAFAGGVFLGAGLIHMLPDAQEGFDVIDGGSDYPWFGLFCCAGFLFILFLEKVIVRHQHSHDDAPGFIKEDLSLYPYVLMLVLSIHSIITGIALGTETRMAQALVILLAVVAHKGTAAFALGVSMLRGKVALRRMVGMIVLFSFMTPLGLLLGIGFMRVLTGHAEQVFEAGFDALAAGSFLYVALLDILQDEFSRHKNSALKFALVLAGLGVMAVVAIWT
ncbi:MAG: ZIP family metal transporter [Spartobacteria bacterium]|nr:ZIP family metal transporter [Spartobacteria bacterium]